MTLNFPAAPADGDIYLNYVYDSTEGVWNANPRQLASRFVTSATTPAEASNGDGWFNTTNGKTYIFYYDGTSGQWIESGYPVLGYQTLENLSDTTIATPTTGQVLKYNGSDWVNDTDNAGKILQVVSTTKTDGDFNTASTTYVDVTGLAATITPSATSSKIIVLVNMTGSPDFDCALAWRVTGGNATTFVGDAASNRIRAIGGARDGSGTRQRDYLNTYAGHFVDSPSTTSATTYQVQIVVNAGTGQVNRAGLDTDNATFTRGISSITLMEVAG